MKKICIFTFILIMMVTFAGCDDKEVTIDGVKTHTILIKSDGTIHSVIFEELDKDYYDKDELEKFINEQIAEFNKSKGSEVVFVEDLSIEDGSAKLSLSYSNMESYMDFNNEVIFIGTIEQALKEGYTLTKTFIEASSSKEIDKSDVVKDLAYNIVIVTENIDVITEKKIKYYSKDSLLLDKHTVQASKDGCMIIFK